MHYFVGNLSAVRTTLSVANILTLSVVRTYLPVITFTLSVVPTTLSVVNISVEGRTRYYR